MKITVQSSKLVRPAYVHSHHGGVLSGVADAVPLTVFDKANFDQYISGINFFHPPSSHPNNTAALEAGLARALAEYREWAGRLGVDVDGNRVIYLNDAGARFVEATADAELTSVLPMEPSPELLSLHPDGEGASDSELMLVQVTRFACGSVAVGHTMHHIVADGRATCNVLLAWGQATRGVPIDPVPVHDRASFFVPRCPRRVEFQHRGVEFKPRREMAPERGNVVNDNDDDAIVMHRARFSKEFVSELKSRASAGASRPYSTLQCLAAHLWRCVTMARGLDDHQVTKLRVAVDGRARLRNPRVPDGYTGNVVLWACPTTTAHRLVNTPLQRAVELINRAVRRVDEAYFKSFIDFASSGAAEAEGLGPASDVAETVLSPDLELDSLLHAPFYEMDFGDGPPFLFMPSYLAVEGAVFVVRSFAGDSSVDAYVPLLSRSVDTFKNCCYSLPAPMAAEARL